MSPIQITHAAIVIFPIVFVLGLGLQSECVVNVTTFKIHHFSETTCHDVYGSIRWLSSISSRCTCMRCCLCRRDTFQCEGCHNLSDKEKSNSDHVKRCKALFIRMKHTVTKGWSETTQWIQRCPNHSDKA